jgi:arylsulfatase A-like enzyme
MGIKNDVPFDGRSLMPLVRGEHLEAEPEMYITECTWMRKHGWRTPQWKLIVALEPDFHFKPEIELYDLIKDPEENHNVADENPEVVETLRTRMENFIAKREKETGRTAPIYTNFLNGDKPFASSQEAYDSKFIGGIEEAVSLQKK